MAAMDKPETKIGELCAELGIVRQTLYRHVRPDGTIRPDGRYPFIRHLEREEKRRATTINRMLATLRHAGRGGGFMVIGRFSPVIRSIGFRTSLRMIRSGRGFPTSR